MIILHLLVRLDGKNYEIITIVYTYFNGINKSQFPSGKLSFIDYGH